MKLKDKITGLYRKAYDFGMYCWTGVWRDSRDTLFVRFIKTANLSVRSFLDRDLQMQAAALVYNTVLAIVPAFALLFAIGRGFGFQNRRLLSCPLGSGSIRRSRNRSAAMDPDIAAVHD